MDMWFLSCPDCKGKLKRGERYFAPAEVKCGGCGAIVASGFPEWANLSVIGKVVCATLELLAPSFISTFSIAGRFFVNAFLMLALWIVASNIAKEQGGIHASLAGIWGVLPIILYLVFLLVRLFRLIGESNRFSESGETPTWRYWLR